MAVENKMFLEETMNNDMLQALSRASIAWGKFHLFSKL